MVELNFSAVTVISSRPPESVATAVEGVGAAHTSPVKSVEKKLTGARIDRRVLEVLVKKSSRLFVVH